MTELPREAADHTSESPESNEVSVEVDSPPSGAAGGAEKDCDLPDGVSTKLSESTPEGGSSESSEEAVTTSMSGSPNDDNQSQLVDRFEEIIRTNGELLRTAFESKLAYDEKKQLQIDRLYEELQQHRADLVGRAARPFTQGMVQLHDDIGKLIVGYRTKPEQISPDRFFKVLEDLQEDVERALGQCGITLFLEPGRTFDPRRQTALKVEDCDDEAIAGTVKKSIRPGFEEDGRVLKKERVSVYRRGTNSTIDND